MPLSSRRQVSRYVHRKVLFRLRRLAIFFVVVAGILIYELSQNYLAGFLAIIGLIIGILIGLSLQRMHIISWDAETSKTVTRMDKLGMIILVAYLLFAVFRHWLIGHWLHGHALSAFSLSVAAGGILGRLVSLRQKIRRILKEEGFLHKLPEQL